MGTTNTGTALTAYLVIHAPWNVTNGFYGLYFNTNLAIPCNWEWLLRCAPDQTNLVVTNLPPTQGFIMLGPPTAIRPGFTNNILERDDDNSTDLIDLPIVMNFFGTTFSNFYVNQNGNITFDFQFNIYNFGAACYRPTNLVETGLNIIAPFWADVDPRNSISDSVHYGTNVVDGRTAFGANWVNVGYYPERADKLDSFQLVLIDRSDIETGDFDMEFNYTQIQWEAGSASGGDGNGFWVGPAAGPPRVGWASASSSTNTFELNGSGVAGALLDTNLTTGLIHSNFNSYVPGRYIFQFRNGIPLSHP